MNSGADLPHAGAGFTAYDMLELPDDQRRLVRLVLHHGHLSYSGICDAVADLPPTEGLSGGELDALLLHLLGLGWLVAVEDAGGPIYHVHLRAVADRAARPARTALRDRVRRLWDALADE